MKIGIFGGSFNPPHNMHLKIAEELICKNKLDKVIFVPTGNNYSYKSNLIADYHRLNMIKLLIKDNSCLEVDDYELKDKEVHTYDTLSYFKNKYPKDSIYFICGIDNLSYMDKWYQGEKILSNFNKIIIRRDTDDLDKILNKFYKYRSTICVFDMELDSISSTYIRNNINDINEKNIKKEIIEYIKENNLYR